MQLVLQALRDPLDHKALAEQLVPLVHKETRVPKVYKAYRGQLDHKGLQGLKELQAQREPKVTKGIPVLPAQ